MLGSINRMDGSNRDWSQAGLTTTNNNTDKSKAEVKIPGVHHAERSGKGELSEADKDKLHKEVEKVNEQLQAQNHSLRFKFSDKAEQFYVEVVDTRTQEVIDSIPGKHMIELAAKLKDMIGFFIDEKR
ncbi:flagellar protein FlaG [Paenibacillus sp. strain BS8-2]